MSTDYWASQAEGYAGAAIVILERAAWVQRPVGRHELGVLRRRYFGPRGKIIWGGGIDAARTSWARRQDRRERARARGGRP